MRKLTKAENRALDAYPMGCYPTANQRSTTDNLRDGYLEGYRQAEKDVKEALMEWAEKELDRLYELIPDASNENPSQMELRYLGQYMQTEILIDKLNSL